MEFDGEGLARVQPFEGGGGRGGETPRFAATTPLGEQGRVGRAFLAMGML